MKNLLNRIELGTVQFGLDYGINNSRGKIPGIEVSEILFHAFNNGIDTLDTAPGYGESEEIIGKILQNNEKLNFKIISKLPKTDDKEKIIKYFNESIVNLKVNRLYGYLAHDTDIIIKNPYLWDELLKLKFNGGITKVGISVYFPAQIEWFISNNIPFDIVQLPYNLFDNRFSYLFDELKDRNIEIHVRSVFLQGLFFKSVEELPDHFITVKPYLNQLKKISAQSNIPINSLLLCFVLSNPKIDKIVLGIDSLQNLFDNITALDYFNKVADIKNDLEQFKIDDEKILLPFNWNKS